MLVLMNTKKLKNLLLEYHTEKDHAIVIDSIKCVDCGKEYFTFKRLTIDM